MPASPQHIDQPEPRGQTIAAVLAVGAIYLALPRNVVVGPIWLLPTVIVVLLVPTVVSHRVGKQSLNRFLGFVINGITTLALIGSVILLVRLLPTHRESPLQLLRSGGLLWLTNVIVFALWYWRLDGGGPTLRQKQRLGCFAELRAQRTGMHQPGLSAITGRCNVRHVTSVAPGPGRKLARTR